MINPYRVHMVFIILLLLILSYDSPYIAIYSRYVVMIKANDKEWGWSSGIYLGKGFVLTAAHVIGGSVKADILAASAFIPGEVVKNGDYDEDDVSLIRIDPSLLPPSIRSAPNVLLCKSMIPIGREVVVVDEHGSVLSNTVAPDALPNGVKWKLSSLIEDVEHSGNSGSGVFDPEENCLLGIMSRRIKWQIKLDNDGSSAYKYLKYFVPSDQIKSFFGGVL